MPVLRRRTHQSSGKGEDEDCGAENHCPRVYVGQAAEDDAGDDKYGSEGRTGEDLVLNPKASVVPVTLPLGLASVCVF